MVHLEFKLKYKYRYKYKYKEQMLTFPLKQLMCKSVFVHSPVFVKRQMQNLSKGGGEDGDGIWNSCHRALVCGETLLLPIANPHLDNTWVDKRFRA